MFCGSSDDFEKNISISNAEMEGNFPVTGLPKKGNHLRQQRNLLFLEVMLTELTINFQNNLYEKEYSSVQFKFLAQRMSTYL